MRTLPAPLAATVRRTGSLAGGLRAGSSTILERSDEAYAAFTRLAAGLLATDLARLRGEQRVATQSTMPLWIQREAAP